MATIGRNISFPIYNGDGTSFHNLVMKKATYDSIVMSLGDKITGDVYYKDNTLVANQDIYIVYNGVHYTLVNPPTIVREGIVSENGGLNGMTKYSFEFYHPMYKLGNIPFSDVAVTNYERMFKSHDRIFSWIGSLDDYVAKLNKNLQGTPFVVSISNSISQAERAVLSDVLPFNDNTIGEALKTGYDTWNYPYVIDSIKSGEPYYQSGKRFLIQYGLPTQEIFDADGVTPFVFRFGKGVGLKNNSRTPKNNKIVTRIAGYGSETNIPYGYPQIEWTGDASATETADGYPIYDGIVGGAVVRLVKHPFTRNHLMPSVYVDSVRRKVNSAASDYDNTIELVDYYDATSTYPNPINLDSPSYEVASFDDIKPELGSASILGATPLNEDLTPASGWDDTMDDDGNYLQSYFSITLPQLDFDLYACAAITEEMKINMRSGACIGCTWDVQVDWDDYKKNFYDEDGNFLPNGEQRDLTKYPKSNSGSITVVVQKEYETFGVIMPNVYQHPASGDEFVILGISLPKTYITNAESRLDDAMNAHMLDNNVYYYEYPLKFDEDFLYRNTNILSQIRTNTVLRFQFAGVEKSLYVKQITIKFGESVLPQYDITLTDDIEIVLNQIGMVAEDVSRLALAMMRQNQISNTQIFKMENLQNYIRYTVDRNIESLQKQVDHAQITYFGNVMPTGQNYPANEWTTDALKEQHVFDMYYDKVNDKGYEWNNVNNTYQWVEITDPNTLDVLRIASKEQDTLDGKRRIFVSQPTDGDEYDGGDLWVNATFPVGNTTTDSLSNKYYNDILKANVHKDSGSPFSITHWGLASKYNLKTEDGNLIRNSGFTGEYESETPTANGQVNANTQMFSDPLRYWEASGVTVSDNSDMTSGKAATLTNGRMRQALGTLKAGYYALSFNASVTDLVISFCGQYYVPQASVAIQRYECGFKLASDAASGYILISGSGVISDIMLTKGSFFGEWKPSNDDNAKELAATAALSYLQNAINNASTDILGGLVLTQMIKVGNFRLNTSTGKYQMNQETGGMSGLMNDGNSPFLWGGGTLEQAIYTIVKYIQNPAYDASPAEVSQMAKFVVTHGGRAILNDIILRGYIYALGAVFKGNVNANGAIFHDLYAVNGTFDGTVKASLFYSTVKEVGENQNYQIDPENDPCHSFHVHPDYYDLPESHITLPKASEYAGLELQFYSEDAVGQLVTNSVTLNAQNGEKIIVGESLLSSYTLQGGRFIVLKSMPYGNGYAWYYVNPVSSDYLPISGGTLTGSLAVTGDITATGDISCDDISADDVNATTGRFTDIGVTGEVFYSSGVLDIQYSNDKDTRICYGGGRVRIAGGDKNNTPALELANGYVDCTYKMVATSFDTSSDERLKDIQGDVKLTIDDFANAPSVLFKWKNKKNNEKVYGGTIAQYWEKIAPWAVSEGKDCMLSVSYGTLALAGVTALARYVRKIVKEIFERINANESEMSRMKNEIDELRKIINDKKQ